MEKTLTIDGRAIRFKSTMALTYRYQAQFGKDILSVIWPAIRFIFQEGAEQSVEAFEKIQTTDIQNIIWVMAKTADKDIEDPFEFWDSLESFPIDYMRELFMMIVGSMQNSEQLKKKLKAVKK